MKHLDLLSLICRHKKLLDEAYKKKRLLSVPSELVEIGLFSKVGGFYYLNGVYFEFVDTLLARADFSYVAEDFERELKRVVELKEEYKPSPSRFKADMIFRLLNRIYQGMKNRDKRVLALIERIEGDEIEDLDVLIKEAKRVLGDVEEIMKKNSDVVRVFESLEGEFGGFVRDVLMDVIKLNQNVDVYLKRLREFISQTEKKRIFNQKLFKAASMILNEESRVDEVLSSKRFVYKSKVLPVVDSTYLSYERAKEVIGKFKKEKKIKKSKVKRDLKEVIELIDLKGLLEAIRGSDDIFKDIVGYVGKVDKGLLNESVRVFVHILNQYDRELVYTKEFNEFNVRVVKWRV